MAINNVSPVGAKPVAQKPTPTNQPLLQIKQDLEKQGFKIQFLGKPAAGITNIISNEMPAELNSENYQVSVTKPEEMTTEKAEAAFKSAVKQSLGVKEEDIQLTVNKDTGELTIAVAKDKVTKK